MLDNNSDYTIYGGDFNTDLSCHNDTILILRFYSNALNTGLCAIIRIVVLTCSKIEYC